mgnify:CR=1 FL=1
MVMQPVSSSNLSSVGYENGTLYISFTNGSYTPITMFLRPCTVI